MICDNVFELLEARQDENIKFIINEYQRFEGVEAYKIRDENSYLEILKDISNPKNISYSVLIRLQLLSSTIIY